MINIILIFLTIITTTIPYSKTDEDVIKHFESIESKSNRIVGKVVSFIPTLHYMQSHKIKAHIKKGIQYEISKPLKSKIGTVYQIEVYDHNRERFNPDIEVYRFIQYPNRLYCYEVKNVSYELLNVHVMKNEIVAVYYSRKYAKLCYKVTYNFDLRITNNEIINCK